MTDRFPQIKGQHHCEPQLREVDGADGGALAAQRPSLGWYQESR
jgi:hypothetical protein